MQASQIGSQSLKNKDLLTKQAKLSADPHDDRRRGGFDRLFGVVPVSLVPGNTQAAAIISFGLVPAAGWFILPRIYTQLGHPPTTERA